MSSDILRSIKYSEVEGKKLDLISLKLGRSKRQVFLQMIDYFHRTRKDPLDINDEILKNTLLKQHREHIGFVKTQENDLLIPTKREVDRLVESQKKVIHGFNGLVKQNEIIPQLMDRQNQYLHQLEIHYKSIVFQLSDKEKLKRLFLNIFEGYAAARDHASGLGSRKEREHLLATTLSQIKLL
ncbi:BfmA/BtgA family mobilization protein [Pedobacter nanyangensis]|uniref:BfmA/BtgA family mobilization protein n=1 Tax=Pedobacter nanyangensis TaxID=1562389 RepID=UPI000DE543C4|nr:BfmA/BtgA family mobilization protein [Pedobacter nanyangensis]